MISGKSAKRCERLTACFPQPDYMSAPLIRHMHKRPPCQRLTQMGTPRKRLHPDILTSRGRNAMAIWQDLIDTCGFSAGYQSVLDTGETRGPREEGFHSRDRRAQASLEESVRT